MSSPNITASAAWQNTGPYQSDTTNTQEVILYCASRLRAAAIALVNESVAARKLWKEKYFASELVCIQILTLFVPSYILYPA
jgi:hypothetical protein